MNILIADDELVSRKKMEKLIQNLGHETLTAQDGGEAWEIWNEERMKMVITDWGYAWYGWLRIMPENTKV